MNLLKWLGADVPRLFLVLKENTIARFVVQINFFFACLLDILDSNYYEISELQGWIRISTYLDVF